MSQLIECPGCTRHVRIDDGRCPFCGRPSTTRAPALALALMLPLTVMACAGGEDKAPAKAKPTAPAKAETKAEAVVEPEPDQPSAPPDLGASADEPVEPVVPDEGREMATKYGAPPTTTTKPNPTTKPRPAKKYGAPPRPKKPGSGGKDPFD
jgi:hypothetical protein